MTAHTPLSDPSTQMRIRNELGLSIIYDPLLVATHQVSLSYGPVRRR